MCVWIIIQISGTLSLSRPWRLEDTKEDEDRLIFRLLIKIGPSQRPFPSLTNRKGRDGLHGRKCIFEQDHFRRGSKGWYIEQTRMGGGRRKW